MKILFAPMEGIAHWLYRSAQHACFDGADEYFLPFWSPRGQSLTHREQADVLPENNAGMKAVPQILSNSSEDFLWAADKLKALGYEEVNINLGCPSGTVVRKHRGAGLLAYPEELERFLDGVFENRRLPCPSRPGWAWKARRNGPPCWSCSTDTRPGG